MFRGQEVLQAVCKKLIQFCRVEPQVLSWLLMNQCGCLAGRADVAGVCNVMACCAWLVGQAGYDCVKGSDYLKLCCQLQCETNSAHLMQGRLAIGSVNMRSLSSKRSTVGAFWGCIGGLLEGRIAPNCMSPPKKRCCSLLIALHRKSCISQRRVARHHESMMLDTMQLLTQDTVTLSRTREEHCRAPKGGAEAIYFMTHLLILHADLKCIGAQQIALVFARCCLTFTVCADWSHACKKGGLL